MYPKHVLADYLWCMHPEHVLADYLWYMHPEHVLADIVKALHVLVLVPGGLGYYVLSNERGVIGVPVLS